jgi:predicted nicotinamide N-methyase
VVGRRLRDGAAAVPAPALNVDVVREDVELGDGLAPLRIARPASSEALIDDARFGAQDEFLPYWAELWPSAVTLARWVGAASLSGLRVLELGCGLALPSVAAARVGADVVATDWAPEAVLAARRNAELNGVALRALTADWRDAAAIAALGPFDVVLAADVLYEARHAEPLLLLLDVLAAPRILLTDPSRATAATFLDAIDATHTRTTTSDPARPAVQLHALLRRSARR